MIKEDVKAVPAWPGSPHHTRTTTRQKSRTGLELESTWCFSWTSAAPQAEQPVELSLAPKSKPGHQCRQKERSLKPPFPGTHTGLCGGRGLPCPAGCCSAPARFSCGAALRDRCACESQARGGRPTGGLSLHTSRELLFTLWRAEHQPKSAPRWVPASGGAAPTPRPSGGPCGRHLPG